MGRQGYRSPPNVVHENGPLEWRRRAGVWNAATCLPYQASVGGNSRFKLLTVHNFPHLLQREALWQTRVIVRVTQRGVAEGPAIRVHGAARPISVGVGACGVQHVSLIREHLCRPGKVSKLRTRFRDNSTIDGTDPFPLSVGLRWILVSL